jgi:hypothetical protein
LLSQQKLEEAKTSNKNLKMSAEETDLAVKEMERRQVAELDEMRNRHSTVIKREKDSHGNEVKRLVGQLLVNQDDNASWTDDKLKFRFQQLQNSINSLVSPRNKEFRVPPGSQLDSLDPTGFLGRATTSKAHFLLQSTIWSILHENFFSAPFGFGIVGDGGGHEKLLEVYLVWARLLGRSVNHSMFMSVTLKFLLTAKAHRRVRKGLKSSVRANSPITGGQRRFNASMKLLWNPRGTYRHRLPQ